MPEPRKNLPPSLSRSVARRLIDSGASASSTRLTVRWSASARTSGPGPSKQGVGAGELDERDAGDAVLRVGDSGVEVLPQLDREQPADPLAVDVREDELIAGRRMRRTPPQHQLAVLARPHGIGGQAGGRRGADHDLAGLRGLLRQGGGRRARAEDEQFARRGADEEQVDVPGVDPHRHLQREAADRRGHGRGLAQRRAHLDRRVTRLLGVVRPREEEQQCVPAELQQLTAPRARDPQHRAEHAVEGLDDLLGADPAPSRQLLGQGGEARHVGEHERPVDDAPQLSGRLVVPRQRDRGDVPAQVGHVSLSA